MAHRIQVISICRPRIEQGNTVQKPELLRAASRATGLVEGLLDYGIIVRRVTMGCNRELHVEIGLNLLKLLDYDTPNRFEGKNKGQIKTAGIHPGWRDDS